MLAGNDHALLRHQTERQAISGDLWAACHRNGFDNAR